MTPFLRAKRKFGPVVVALTPPLNLPHRWPCNDSRLNEESNSLLLCSCWWGSVQELFSGSRSEHGSIPGVLPIAICRTGMLQGRLPILVSRELWWQGWAPAQKDHGTICISCHTVVPYVTRWHGPPYDGPSIKPL